MIKRKKKKRNAQKEGRREGNKAIKKKKKMKRNAQKEGERRPI